MEHQEAKTLLLDQGFSDWEADAYVCLIRYGPQTAKELSKLTKIPRSKTYEVITRLRRKGLVIKVPPMPSKGVTQKFVANDPKEVFPQKLDNLKLLSDYLSTTYNNPAKPRYPDIHFYTTKELARKFLMKVARESDSFFLYLGNQDLQELLNYSFNNFISEIEKKKHKIIILKTAAGKLLAKEIKTSKFTSQKGAINYLITEKSLILDLWKSQHLILEIRSKQAVDTFKRMFD